MRKDRREDDGLSEILEPDVHRYPLNGEGRLFGQISKDGSCRYYIAVGPEDIKVLPEAQQ
jgi:hypothetical protein